MADDSLTTNYDFQKSPFFQFEESGKFPKWDDNIWGEMDADESIGLMAEKILASPPLFEQSTVTDFVRELTTCQRTLRAALATQTKSVQELSDLIEEDEDFAEAIDDVQQCLESEIARLKSLPELMENISIRLQLSLASRPHKDSQS